MAHNGHFSFFYKVQTSNIFNIFLRFLLLYFYFIFFFSKLISSYAYAPSSLFLFIFIFTNIMYAILQNKKKKKKEIRRTKSWRRIDINGFFVYSLHVISSTCILVIIILYVVLLKQISYEIDVIRSFRLLITCYYSKCNY